MKKLLSAVHRVFVGLLMSQNPLTAVMIIGWTYRLMQRSTLKSWWSRSPLRSNGGSFDLFLRADEVTARHQELPRWFSGGSLLRNARLGLQGSLATWSATIPAGALWVWAWYSGWDNSFNKGYEQFWVGPLSGWIGVLLFIAAMLYVPLAQARHAATGDWRSFFEFRVVRKVIASTWLETVGIAALYSLLSIPVMMLRTAPGFFGRGNPVGMEQMTNAQLAGGLTVYFLLAALIVFPSFLLLRLLAAKVYAVGVVRAVRRGRLEMALLSEFEVSQLARLQLDLSVKPRPARLAWTMGSAGLGSVVVGVLVLIWFSFVAQIFVAEFLNYHAGVGWLNQPLVHLPWIRYIPTHL